MLLSTGPGSGSLAGSNPLMQHALNPLNPEDMTTILDTKRVGEMERMVETYPWETTDLGPKEGWSQALKTALSICLRSPTSVSECTIPERGILCFAIAEMVQVV